MWVILKHPNKQIALGNSVYNALSFESVSGTLYKMRTKFVNYNTQKLPIGERGSNCSIKR
jgi:hypothetical protein